MTNEKHDTTEPRRRSFDRSIENTVDAGAELTSGVAHALGNGIQVAGRQISGDNATRLGVDNGVVQGVVEGSIRVLEDLPDVLRRSYDVLANRRVRSDDDPSRS